MTDAELFALAADKARVSRFSAHAHSKTCTFEVCGVGPTRDQLISDTVLKKIRMNQRLEHYDAKTFGENAMRTLPSARLPAAPVHRKGWDTRGTNVSKTDSTTRRAQSAEAGGAHAR